MHTIKKRFIFFSILMISLLLMPCVQPVFKNDFKENVTYFFYTQNISNDIKNATIINNGNSTIIKCNSKDASNIKSQIKSEIFGESIRIDNFTTETYEKIICKYQNYIIKEEKCDDYKIFLCYDKTLKNNVYIYENKVNIQIAISNCQINIGYPLIFNGF